ncbi:MAG TPA: ThiF family adenylyltransferase [Bryobacteraceae bacterium]|nr:ThiF family adenylyltransferase [Bryobacteraceae bacterium]
MTPGDRERYSRQIRYKPLGEDGQQRILSSCVAIVGCGALGTVQAAMMARAGVRKLTVIDRDYVEISNLQRQWLFDESDVEQSLPKAIAAAAHIRRADSSCQVDAKVTDLTPGNAEEMLEGADLLLDGTDNFETRYLMNDYAVHAGIPWIYGAAIGSYGITMPIVPEQTPCFRCVFPSAPLGAQATCETAGVLGGITAAIASLQSATALKFLAGSGADIAARITTIDVWSGDLRQVGMGDRDPACESCGTRRFPHLSGSRRIPVSLCGRNAVQIHERTRPIDLAQLGMQLGQLGEVRSNEFALRFFTSPYEITIFPDGRAIIKGTTDPGIARSLYARYVGA